jgi:hypothetical protein
MASLVCAIASPLHAGITIRNGLSHQFNVSPGKTYSGKIEIQNEDPVFQGVTVYKNDFLTRAGGESLFTDSVIHPRSSMDWITLNPAFVNIEPSSSAIIGFEIRVPDGPVLEGTYWSVIMVEPAVPLDTIVPAEGINIRTVTRYAIQVICTIGDTGRTEIQFQSITQDTAEGRRTLQVDLDNNGDRFIRPVIGLEIYTPEGNLADQFKSVQQGLFPFSQKRFLIDISRLGDGLYKAVLIADCGDELFFGANADLVIRK